MRKIIVSFILAIVIIGVWVVAPFPIPKLENRCAHISIDDVEVCMRHLANDSQKYESLFEEPFFYLLQILHNSFGAKFTLYIYAEANNYDIENIPLKFKNEFIANAEWLKFGFHSIRPQFNITATANTDSLITAFEKVNRNIIRFGDSLSLSQTLRLHYFYMTVDERVRITRGGVKTLLTADNPERNSYGMTAEEQLQLQNGSFTDTLCHYLATDHRVEHMLIDPYFNLLSKEEPDTLVVFTHEWALANKLNRIKLKRILQILYRNKVKFII